MVKHCIILLKYALLQEQCKLRNVWFWRLLGSEFRCILAALDIPRMYTQMLEIAFPCRLFSPVSKALPPIAKRKDFSEQSIGSAVSRNSSQRYFCLQTFFLLIVAVSNINIDVFC